MKLEKDMKTTLQYLDPIMPSPNLDRNGSKNAETQLRIHDYLAALHRAKQIGWADFHADRFDFEGYRQLDSPLNADLHEVVPGKIIMMCGPRDLPGGVHWRDVPKEDGRFGHREFSVKLRGNDEVYELSSAAVSSCSTGSILQVQTQTHGWTLSSLQLRAPTCKTWAVRLTAYGLKVERNGINCSVKSRIRPTMQI